MFRRDPGRLAVTSRGPLEVRWIESQQRCRWTTSLCVREKRESIVGGAMSRRDMRIIDAIDEAARAGKRIPVRA